MSLRDYATRDMRLIFVRKSLWQRVLAWFRR